MRQGRIRQSTRSQQTHCRTFSNRARGSDPKRVWNATDCKCAPEVLLAGVSTKRVAEWPGHLNRKEIQEIRRNILKNFTLHSFGKHLHWFRCSGKGEHLNPASRLNATANPLTTNALQGFRQLCPWFRSQPGLECHRLQMRPRGASGWGIHQTRSRTAQASEPERNLKKHHNALKSFLLHGLGKYIPWFRCSGKGEHLNPASRLNATANSFTTNALQDFQQPCPRFRSQAGMECHRPQMCPRDASG